MTPSRLVTDRPVVLVDGGSVGTLGLARSVGRAGIPVQLLAHRRDSPAVGSRYVSRTHRFDPDELRGGALVDALLETAHSLDRRGVFLTASDSQLRALSPHREALSSRLDLDFASRRVVETCLDKGAFGRMGESIGLRVPASHSPESEDDLREGVRALDFPVFVKPSRRGGWRDVPKGIVESFKGVRRDDAEAVLRLYRELAQHGADDVVVEEFVVGPDRGHVSVHLYRTTEGDIRGLCCSRKVRVWPAHAGVGCMIVTEENRAAEELARDTVAKLGLTGFASVQMKEDVRRNRYFVHEINASRYSSWVELPSVAGCNLPLVAYALMTDQSPPPTAPRSGVGWIDLGHDLESFRTYRESGEWSWHDYLLSLRQVRCAAYFAADDPGPFARRVSGRIRTAIERRSGRRPE